MAKNTHNKSEKVGSKIERSDDRIRETGEVFTPMKLCRKMVSEIPKDQISNGTFLDNSAGCGNFLEALVEVGVNKDRIYCVELMYDNYLEICERLKVKPNNKEIDANGEVIAYRGGNLNFVCANALKYRYEFGGKHPYEMDMWSL